MKAQDIAVVGAGPAGLSAALLLRRAGYRVTVFERFDRPGPVGSGLILQPTGLTVLARLGLLDEILSLGARVERLYGSDARTGRTVLDVRYDALPGGRFGLAVHRAALFGVLARAVQREGISLETASTILDVECDASGARLIGERGGSPGRFDLVVDASGARSVLRCRAEASTEPKRLAYGAYWASVPWRDEGFDRHALMQRYERASVMIGVLPIGRPSLSEGPMAAFFWSLRPNDEAAVRAAGIAQWKERVVDLWPACAPHVEPIDDFDQLTLARYGHHTLVRPIARRLAVIGDAAHSTSPQLGQGANMALLDAAALAHALDRAKGVEEALEAYAAARRWHVRLFQALSAAFTPFYQSDSRLLPILRDRLVATLARVPPAPQFLAALVAGTVIDPFAKAGLVEEDWRTIVMPHTTWR